MYDILELNKKLLPELREIAKELNIKRVDSFKKQELIYKILDQQAIAASEAKTSRKDNNSGQRPVKSQMAAEEKTPQSDRQRRGRPKKNENRPQPQNQPQNRQEPAQPEKPIVAESSCCSEQGTTAASHSKTPTSAGKKKRRKTPDCKRSNFSTGESRFNLNLTILYLDVMTGIREDKIMITRTASRVSVKTTGTISKD